LWDSLSAVYRAYVLYYTDIGVIYEKVFHRKRHESVGRDTGKNFDRERFNNTLMQRISQTMLFFYKKISNYVGAIGYFIHDYEASLSLKVSRIFPGYAERPKNLSLITKLAWEF